MCSRSHIAVLLAVVAVVMAGCRPKGILHSREMRSLLADLHKTDAMIEVKGIRTTSNEEKEIYYAQVLEKHGVTQAQFDSSLVWYTAHPQFFNKIYPRVLKDLAAEQEAFERLHADELAVPNEEEAVTVRTFTAAQLDSLLWVMRNGWPSTWYPMPLMHDTIDQFFPQIGVFGSGVIDTLETRVDLAEIADD